MAVVLSKNHPREFQVTWTPSIDDAAGIAEEDVRRYLFNCLCAKMTHLECCDMGDLVLHDGIFYVYMTEFEHVSVGGSKGVVCRATPLPLTGAALAGIIATMDDKGIKLDEAIGKYRGH